MARSAECQFCRGTGCKLCGGYGWIDPTTSLIAPSVDGPQNCWDCGASTAMWVLEGRRMDRDSSPVTKPVHENKRECQEIQNKPPQTEAECMAERLEQVKRSIAKLQAELMELQDDGADVRGDGSTAEAEAT